MHRTPSLSIWVTTFRTSVLAVICQQNGCSTAYLSRLDVIRSLTKSRGNAPRRKDGDMQKYPTESTLRRTLKKLGFKLIKSRAKHWSLQNQLGYEIVMIGCEGVVWGRNFELSIEDILYHIRCFS